MSVFPISTNAIEPCLDVKKQQAVPLLQAIFEILSEGTIRFNWQEHSEHAGICEAEGITSTAPVNDKVELVY
jgi:hypothetical protein